MFINWKRMKPAADGTATDRRPDRADRGGATGARSPREAARDRAARTIYRLAAHAWSDRKRAGSGARAGTTLEGRSR